MYSNDTAFPATDMLETKIIINSAISDARREARFITLNSKDHFLATSMKDPEYMRVQLKYILEDIRKRYIIINIDTKDE